MNPFDAFLKNLIKRALLLLLALVGAGCAPAGSSSVSGSPAAPVVVPPLPGDTAQSITTKGGSGFSCFSIAVSGSDRIYCRTEGSPDARLGIVSASWALYAEHSDSLTSFEVWNDTICLSGQVTQRPQSRSAGLATYCLGEATLGPAYSGYPIVYSGPSFSLATNGSTEVAFHGTEAPFAGADLGVGLFTNDGGVWNVMMDGLELTHTAILNCTVSADGSTLTCPSFAVGL